MERSLHNLLEVETVDDVEERADHRPERLLSPEGLFEKRRLEDDVLGHVRQHRLQVLALHGLGEGANVHEIHESSPHRCPPLAGDGGPFSWPGRTLRSLLTARHAKTPSNPARRTQAKSAPTRLPSASRGTVDQYWPEFECAFRSESAAAAARLASTPPSADAAGVVADARRTSPMPASQYLAGDRFRAAT